MSCKKYCNLWNHFQPPLCGISDDHSVCSGFPPSGCCSLFIYFQWLHDSLGGEMKRDLGETVAPCRAVGTSEIFSLCDGTVTNSRLWDEICNVVHLHMFTESCDHTDEWWLKGRSFLQNPRGLMERWVGMDLSVILINMLRQIYIPAFLQVLLCT